MDTVEQGSSGVHSVEVVIATVRRVFVVFFAVVTAQTASADGPLKGLEHEVIRYAQDAKSLAAAPLHWDRAEWTRFAAGTAAVAALYATDRWTTERIQQNRTSSTNDFAKFVTPFGGHRAIDMSLLLVAAGAGFHDTNLRDAGRDSLESELWAAGIVTPALKVAFGRARPIQGEGARSFHPFDSHFQSFPSGHATNAFAFATAVAAHYDGWVVPTIVYTIASGVAISRVNDHVHFPSDVLAGALIGRAVAKGVVARHMGHKVAWRVLPIVSGRNAGVLVTIER